MKHICAAAAGIGLLSLLAGCVTVSQSSFSFDFDTGEIRREYRDLASRPGADEKDYSVTNDWAILQRMIADPEPEFDPKVVEEVSRALFEDDGVLCARKIQKVTCPGCFPSRAAILSYVHDKDWRFELINDEVVLFFPGGKKLVSTNGQKVTTARNTLIVWPQDTRTFEYVFSEEWPGGTSLLPYYLEEREAAPEPAREDRP